MIDAGFLPPKEFIKLELKTIEGLKNLLNKLPGMWEINGVFDQAINRYRSAIRKKVVTPVDYEVKIEIESHANDGTAEPYIIFFGGLATFSSENKYENMSYYFAICKKSKAENGLILLRKVHFDYAPSESKEKYHPVFHMHYGGEITPRMSRELILNYESCNSWLSIPRIPSTPISTGILLEILFNEFRNNELSKISGTNRWKNIMCMQKDKLMKGYYATMHEECTAERMKKTPLMDIQRGITN